MPQTLPFAFARRRAPASPLARGARTPRHLFEYAVVVVAVALRVPFLAAPARADEAGFLQVAAQWSPDGGSLYGHYWVDRPPLLITLFQAAAAAGGLVPLRLIGCLAVALTILLSARAAELVAGPKASRWTAATAGALLVAPQLGSQEVDGELLAAPFVAGGVLALAAASRRPYASWLPFAGGACGAGALLVKQNIADVGIFAVALVAALWWLGRRAHLAGLVAAFVAGALVTVLVVSAWTVAHGTSLPAVLHAMYAFRVEAGETLADGGGLVYAHARADALASAWLLSGLAWLTLAFALGVRRWVFDPVLVALSATIVFDLVSVALGGGYWSHYLVQMVVPLCIGVGALAATGRLVPAGAALATIALAAVPAVGALTEVPTTSTAATIGTSVRDVSRPGDTLVTLYGQPQVNLAAGLPSPYAHLWSLPTRTLDPELTELDAVLAGPGAPTWLVVKHEVSSWGLDTTRTSRLVAHRYHPVALYRGQSVYLRNDLSRPTPIPGGGP